MEEKIYIAYGSNLNLKQMAQRCPTAKVLGTSELKDYEIIFRGSKTGAYANIEPCKGKTVPILLWTVKNSDEQALDRYEGYPVFYEKEPMEVEFNNEKVTAFAYRMTPGHQLGIPTDFYINTILEGYEEFDFDEQILFDSIENTKQLIKKEQNQNISFGQMQWWC